jgi:hypothetical protein
MVTVKRQSFFYLGFDYHLMVLRFLSGLCFVRLKWCCNIDLHYKQIRWLMRVVYNHHHHQPYEFRHILLLHHVLHISETNEGIAFKKKLGSLIYLKTYFKSKRLYHYSSLLKFLCVSD